MAGTDKLRQLWGQEAVFTQQHWNGRIKGPQGSQAEAPAHPGTLPQPQMHPWRKAGATIKAVHTRALLQSQFGIRFIGARVAKRNLLPKDVWPLLLQWKALARQIEPGTLSITYFWSWQNSLCWAIAYCTSSKWTTRPRVSDSGIHIPYLPHRSSSSDSAFTIWATKGDWGCYAPCPLLTTQLRCFFVCLNFNKSYFPLYSTIRQQQDLMKAF